MGTGRQAGWGDSSRGGFPGAGISLPPDRRGDSRIDCRVDANVVPLAVDVVRWDLTAREQADAIFCLVLAKRVPG